MRVTNENRGVLLWLLSRASPSAIISFVQSAGVVHFSVVVDISITHTRYWANPQFLVLASWVGANGLVFPLFSLCH